MAWASWRYLRDSFSLFKEMSALINQIATKDDINNLHLEIKQANSIMLKWMLVFWIGQFGATIAAVVILLKK